MTHQREVILNEVRQASTHLTADEIYERVRKRLPRISMGTVYRNLDILATCGLIRKVDPGRPQMRFDGKTGEHYHITCVVCGHIEDAPFKPSENALENLENVLGNLTKYGIFGHKLEFIGVCSSCLEEKGMSVEDFLEVHSSGGVGQEI